MYINNNIDYLKWLKNKEIYIFGAGQKGKTILHKLMDKYSIKAFIDNDIRKVGGDLYGIKIISVDEFRRMDQLLKVIIISSNEREISLQLTDLNIYNFVCGSQIDFGGGEDYYDDDYFKWQRQIGEFGAKVKARLFMKYIKPNMSVLEFGSGGGFLLKELQMEKSLGIEINDVARKFALSLGVESVKNISDVDDEFADIIISNSVLEHVENPLECLRELYKKLKPKGKIVFYVPNESCDTEYSRSEINNHLYTWNCLNIGNLFKAAGFFVYSVEKIQEIWPIHYQIISDQVSDELFDDLASIGGQAANANRCLIVAFK